MTSALAGILSDPRIWKGDSFKQCAQPARSTGFGALDAELPGGGWPAACVTELVSAHVGNGVMRLLTPALARLGRDGGHLLLIDPPFIPYAPALAAAAIDLRRLSWVQPASEADKLWALEQSLREPACAAVLAWHRGPLPDRLCRRLQLAAEQGGGLGFLVRLEAAGAVQSPFGLRLEVEAREDGLQIRILKRRGPPLATPIRLTLEREEAHALVSPVSAEARAGYLRTHAVPAA